jgi:hypothetical protein
MVLCLSSPWLDQPKCPNVNGFPSKLQHYNNSFRMIFQPIDALAGRRTA